MPTTTSIMVDFNVDVLAEGIYTWGVDLEDDWLWAWVACPSNWRLVHNEVVPSKS